MKLKCIGVGDFKDFLTIGNEYILQEFFKDSVVIIHNKGYRGMFPIYLFDFCCK